MDKSVFLLAVINGAKGDDKSILDNKTTVGLEFERAGLDNIAMAINALKDITYDSSTVNSSICRFIPSRCDSTEDKTSIKQTTDEVTTPIIPTVSTPKETTTSTKPTNGETAPDTRAMTVKGSVVDGIIYDGKINISDMDGNSLGSTTTDDDGGYSLYIPKLPKQYKVSVDGGKDSGADGEINENDQDSSFGMNAIVDREDSGDDSMANISPATTVVANIVEDGAIGVDNDSVDLIGDMINENIDLDSSLLASKMVKVSTSYQKIRIKIKNSFKITHKTKLKKMISKVYKNSDLDDIDALANQLEDESRLESLDTIAGEIASKSSSDGSDVEDMLQDMVASKVALSSDEESLREVVADNGLYQSVKKVVKIKKTIKAKKTITREDRAKLVSSSTVMESIKASVKSKTYTRIDSSATDAMLANLTATLQQSQANIEAYQEKILALQLSLADLTKAFNSATYTTKVSNSISAVKKIRAESTVSIIKTIKKIKIVIVKKFVTNNSYNYDDIIDSNIVIPEPKTRTIRLPQPMLKSLPSKMIKFKI